MYLKKEVFLILACLFLVSRAILPLRQAAAGDTENGMRIFQRCATCHYADREGNKIGPSLKNVLQRQAGTEPGYKFSPAMVKAGETGLLWNKKNLSDFLHNPQALVKGTRMPPVKITSQQDMDDLIAYLQKASQK